MQLIENAFTYLMWLFQISGDFFWLIQWSSQLLEYINKIFAEKHDIFVLICLNKIFIYTKNSDQSYVTAV